MVSRIIIIKRHAKENGHLSPTQPVPMLPCSSPPHSICNNVKSNTASPKSINLLNPTPVQPKPQILALTDIKLIQVPATLNHALHTLARHTYTAADGQVAELEEVESDAT